MKFYINFYLLFNCGVVGMVEKVLLVLLDFIVDFGF